MSVPGFVDEAARCPESPSGQRASDGALVVRRFRLDAACVPVEFEVASGGTCPCGTVVEKVGGWCGNCVGSRLYFRTRLEVTSAFERGPTPFCAPDPEQHQAMFQSGVTHPDPQVRETVAMYCDPHLLTLDARRLLLDDAEMMVRRESTQTHSAAGTNGPADEPADETLDAAGFFPVAARRGTRRGTPTLSLFSVSSCRSKR